MLVISAMLDSIATHALIQNFVIISMLAFRATHVITYCDNQNYYHARSYCYSFTVITIKITTK